MATTVGDVKQARFIVTRSAYERLLREAGAGDLTLHIRDPATNTEVEYERHPLPTVGGIYLCTVVQEEISHCVWARITVHIGCSVSFTITTGGDKPEVQLGKVVAPADFDLYKYWWDNYHNEYAITGIEMTTDAWYGHVYHQNGNKYC